MGRSHGLVLALLAMAAVCWRHTPSFVLGGQTQGTLPQALHRKLPATGPSPWTKSRGLDWATIGFAACGVAFGLGLPRLSAPKAFRRMVGSALSRTPMRYTTKEIIPTYIWLKTGFKTKDLSPGDINVVCLAGCDIAFGKTGTGKLFAVGDKAPPTGISFALGSEMRGDSIVEQQFGNVFNVSTGEPEGDWCPSPPIIGGVVGAFMGGPMKIAVYDIREDWLSKEVEVQVDSNAKRAYEANYWKGLLDAQGKDDGTFY